MGEVVEVVGKVGIDVGRGVRDGVKEGVTVGRTKVMSVTGLLASGADA